MKSCPSCLTQYTDDTLSYCLQDGSLLTTEFTSESPTVVAGETETFVNPRVLSNKLDTRPDISTAVIHDSGSKPRGSRTAVAVAATVFVMLAIFVLLGAGAFLYYRSKGSAVSSNISSANGKGNPNEKNVSPPTNRTPTRIDNREVTPSPLPDSGLETVTDDVRSEVWNEIDDWRSATEEMDIDSLVGHYASRVEYYNKSAADSSFIRADKNRAFSRFDVISMKISNVEVTNAGTAGTFNVFFDKEWRFSGATTSTGKVRQLLQIKKIGGRWLITAEKDLKVFGK